MTQSNAMQSRFATHLGLAGIFSFSFSSSSDFFLLLAAVDVVVYEIRNHRGVRIR